MKKESVKKFDLEAAFKALDEIEIPQAKGIKANRVDLKERFRHKSATEILVEDYYDVSSAEDLKDAKEERDGEVAKAKLARIEKIVDLNAESPEELLPSYVGKVIMQCPQCMTLFYKNPEDIEPSEENPEIVNLNEPCQHCGNTSGYTLIGKVGAVTEDEADKYEEAPTKENENELNLDFGKGTEEADAEGTGEGAEEMSDEETKETKEESSDETSSDKDLDLNLDEIPEEEPEEKKKEESLKESKATKQRLTVVEPGYQYKDKDGNLYTLYGDELEEDDTGITYDWEFVDDENGDVYIKEEMAEEKSEKSALKESVESEIDSIIASWDVNESLIKEDKSLPLRSIKVKDKENSRKGISWLVVYGEKDSLHKEFKNEEEAKKFAKENNGKLMPIRTTEVKESLNLTEEGDLDRLLDSDEFKTPVSEEEINAARREVAKESLKEEKEDESMAPTIYNLFLDDKLVYESESIPLNKALSEITAYIKKLTPEQKRSFSLSWEFDESEHSGYRNVHIYDKEGNIVGSKNEWVETVGDVVVGVFSEAECKEYGYAFPEDRFVINVDYAGDAIRKALDADVTANLNESDDEESEEIEIEDPEFSEDDIDELDECSLNKHIDEYLKEVYSNVKSYETTDCELKEGKLIVEGKISFNSGKEKLTMFEFLPAYCKGKLFFEGYNKDFSEDKAFTLNCSINKSKTLITESFGYKYKINKNLVKGLK